MPSLAQDDGNGVASPRWMVQLGGGRFEPELEGYRLFYGDDEARYWSVNPSGPTSALKSGSKKYRKNRCW